MGVSRLFYSLPPLPTSVKGVWTSSRCDERHTGPEIARHGRPRTGRGTLWPRKTWNLQKRNFGHAPNSFGPRLPSSALHVPLVFILNCCTDYFTYLRIEISGEGFQFWRNGASNFKLNLNLFIYFFPISNWKIQVEGFYSKSKEKEKLKIQIPTSLLYTSLSLSFFVSRLSPILPRTQL